MEKKEERPWCMITEMDQYLFGQGTHYEIYKKLGAHPMTYNGKKGIYFGVWAPHAQAVHLVGDFNGWNPEANPMKKVGQSGIWEYFNAGMQVGELYKFAITTDTGKILYKADPFAFSAEYRPGTASVTADISGFSWNDGDWISKRSQADMTKQPISIYEVHLGSWKKKDREEKDGYYTYVEAAHELAAYVKEMGYTHVELLPITEYPFDGSWGYQVTGYFAPTSRYGTPKDFMAFVDKLHQAGIGVILDWVPAHFPKDGYGLYMFDGAPCYEDPNPRRGEHKEWGTMVFNYGMKEVESFLISSAMFWVDRYHVDGLRVDAVASMLYLDYNRKDGEWEQNVNGGKENLEAIAFLQKLNTAILGRYPHKMMIAEESTAYPGITAPTDAGGLGFGLKWNMGWMHDTLQYLHEEPINRKWHHNEITFSMVYAYSEHYVLPISHDEVVYGKGSMFGKMPGNDWQKYAGVRALFAYQWAHPGKNLTFMGNEIAQYGEWDHDGSVDWAALEWPDHQGVQKLVADLNTLYKASPALWSQDFDPAGFQWLTSDDADHNTLSFVRIGKDGEQMVVVVNFSGEAWTDYQVPLTKGGKWTEVLTTDDEIYGGSGIHNGTVEAIEGEYHSRDWSAKITVPALGAVFLKPEL